MNWEIVPICKAKSKPTCWAGPLHSLLPVFISACFLFLFNCSACFQQALESNKWINVPSFLFSSKGQLQSVVMIIPRSHQTLFNEQHESAGTCCFPELGSKVAKMGCKKPTKASDSFLFFPKCHLFCLVIFTVYPVVVITHQLMGKMAAHYPMK